MFPSPICILKYFLFFLIYRYSISCVLSIFQPFLCNNPSLSRYSTYKFLQGPPSQFQLFHYPKVFIHFPQFSLQSSLFPELVIHLLNLRVFCTVFIAKTPGSFQSLKTHREKEYVFFQ